MFSDRDDPAPPPPKWWQARLNPAVATVRTNVTDPSIIRRVSDIEGALWNADADCVRLRATIDQLNPQRASRELKDSLRRRHEEPSAANSTAAESLQRRHESINALLDRIEEIERYMESTISDIEALAASSARLALLGDTAPLENTVPKSLMDHLAHDLDVLAQVHDQMADL